MAFVQADLDALDAAIKKGVRRVAYLSGSVEYHSLDEMLKLREIMRVEISGETFQGRTVGSYSSGLSGAVYNSGGRRRR